MRKATTTKIKKMFALLLATAMVLCTFPIPAIAVDAVDETSETSETDEVDFNEIRTVEDLYNVRNDLTANYKLMNDIDLTEATAKGGDFDINGNGWNPIGSNDGEFSGIFDGNGHKIIGMRIEVTSVSSGITEAYFGLFSKVSGEVKNLTVDGGSISVDVKCKCYVGGICGYVQKGSISYCYNTGVVTDAVIGKSNHMYYVYVGGVVGDNNGGTVTNCYNTGAVSGKSSCIAHVGGVVGDNNGGTVTNCYNTGAVSGKSSTLNAFVGGVVGYNNGGTVTNCYNTGDVTGIGEYPSAGGVVGYNDAYGGTATVTNCYNTGAVTGTSSSSSSDVGGVVGVNNDGIVTNCYNTGDISSDDIVGGVVGHNYAECGTVTNCYNTGNVTGIGECAYVGGVVGYNNAYDSTVTNCYNTGNVTGTSLYIACVGGVVGYNKGGIVTNCYNTGDISGNGTSSYASETAVYVGGVVGDNNDGTVTNCYNTGVVTGAVSGKSNDLHYNDVYVGGVVGRNNGGTVTGCYNTGDISGNGISSYTDVYVGGVVGYNYANGGTATLTNCYNTGAVTGTSSSSSAYVGGVVGYNDDTVTNCYYLNTCVTNPTSTEGTALNDTEMKLQESFVGFDFDEIWTVQKDENNGYPILKCFESPIKILGASIRTEDPYGMRFAVRVSDNSPKKIASYGVIMLPTEMLGANELTVNTSDVLNIPAKVFFEKGNPDYVEGTHTFTGVLMDIPDGAWDWAISARGYVKYEDGTYDYTDTISRTYIGIAKACYADQTPEVQAILESIFGEGFALTGGVVGDDNTGVWKGDWD